MRLELIADDFGGFEIVGDRAHRLAPGADAQQHFHRERGGDRDHECHDLRLRQEERPEHRVLAGEYRTRGARVRAEDELRDHLQDQRAADRRQQLIERGVTDEVAEHDLVLRHADERREQKTDRQDQQRIDTECLGRDDAGEHAVHHQFAVREIDDPHHAEGETKPDRENAVNASNENSAEDRLQRQ